MANALTVDQAIRDLKCLFPGISDIQDGEAWGGDERYKGSIHLGDAAEGGMIDGMPAADSYLDNNDTFGVHQDLATALDDMGYFAEWYDGGTLLAYKI